MIYTGEAIKKLIPQRDPVILVDTMFEPEGNEYHTSLLVRENNYFLEATDRLMAEPGLLEHIAQSANAAVSYERQAQGQPCAALYVAEVKKFHCYRRPRTGEVLDTQFTLDAQTADTIALVATVRVGQEVIADTQLKMMAV